MTDYTGKDLVVQWIYSGGTIALTSDYRTAAYTPSVDLVEASAGNDTHKTYLVALKDGKFSLTYLDQTGGTAIMTACAEGTSGTLKIYPEGTAGGKPSQTIPAIAMGAQRNYPYNDVVEISVEWQQNGARVDA